MEIPRSSSSFINRSFPLIVLAVTTLVLVPGTLDGTFLKSPLLLFLTSCYILYSIFMGMNGKEIHFQLSLAHIFIGIFLVVESASLIHALNIERGLTALLSFGCYAVIALTSLSNSKTAGQRLFSLCGIVCVAGVVGVAGLFQLIVSAPSSWLFISGNQTIVSTLGNSAYLGGFLAAVLPLLFALLLVGQSRWKHFSFAILIVACVLLYFTEARSAWIAGTVGLLLMILWTIPSGKKKISLVALSILLVVGFIFLFPDVLEKRVSLLFSNQEHSSIQRRMVFYESAWKAFLHSPWIGNGIGNFEIFLPAFRSSDYWISRSEDIVPHAHNEYLEILSESGLTGLIAFVSILVIAGIGLARSLKNADDRSKIIFIGCGCGIVAILVDNFASMTLRTIPVAVLFWMLVGLISGSQNRWNIRLALPDWTSSIRWIVLGLILPAGYLFSSHVTTQYKAQQLLLEGNEQRRDGKKDLAFQTLSSVLRLDSDLPSTRLFVASSLVERGKYAEALAHTDTILAKYPYLPKVRIARAIALLETAKSTQAQSVIEEELDFAATPQAYYYSALISARNGDTSRALTLQLKQFEANYRGKSKNYLIMGLAQFSSLQKGQLTEEMKKQLQRVAQEFAGEEEVLHAVRKAYQTSGLTSEGSSLPQN